MSRARPAPDQVRLRDFPRLVTCHRAARARQAAMAEPDLTYLFWESTLRCNLRCQHCGSSCEATAPVRELETSQVLEIVATIAEDFDARRIFVSITGGEPLLRPDVFEVTAAMTRVGMSTCVVTNGTLLTDEAACRLFDAGMRTVSISIDGNESQHEAMRGKGTYAKALAGVTAARRAGFEIVEVITCVRPANLDSLGAVEGAARNAGAHLWRLITIDAMGRLADCQERSWWLGPREVRRLFDFIEGRRSVLERTRADFDVQFSCGGFLGVHREERVRPVSNQCSAGQTVGSILCDGQVGACPSLPRSWAQGSALEERFSAIWRSRFRRHREVEWRRSGACKDCDWFDLCLGGGLHEREAQPDDFCWLARQCDV